MTRVIAKGPGGLVLRTLDLRRDAEALAAMWRASDDQWPGGWSGGVEETAETVRHRESMSNPIEVAVWEAGSELVGYCSVMKPDARENSAYIGLLNVSPKFQGRGLARIALVHYVEWCATRGYDRLDLHTWAGNVKSVPLYKKCGFCWDPGNEVHLFNHVPALLGLPAAREFFAANNWYSAHQRALLHEPDDDRWEGVKVRTYHFAGKGGELVARFGRASNELLSLALGGIEAALLTREPEPIQGLPTEVAVRVRNPGKDPISVDLRGEGSPHVTMSMRATFTLEPGEEQTAVATATVDSDVPASDREPGPGFPRVRANLNIGGVPLELAAGYVPRAGLEVSTWPRVVALRPGHATEAALLVQNRTGADVDAALVLTSSPGLRVTPAGTRVRIKKGLSGSVPVTITAEAEGAYRLTVAASMERDGKSVSLPPSTLNFAAVAPGGLVAFTDVEETTVVHTDRYLVEVPARGTRISFRHRDSGETAAAVVGLPGPPAWPSEWHRARTTTTFSEQEGRLLVNRRTASAEHPGFFANQHIEVTRGDMVRVAWTFENASPGPVRYRLLSGASPPSGTSMEPVHQVLPLSEGPVRGLPGTFPGPQGRTSGRSLMAEPWIAFESSHETFGMIWPAGSEVTSLDWGLRLQGGFIRCAPGETVAIEPTWIYLGRGGWREVRRRYLDLGGKDSYRTRAALAAAPVQRLAARSGAVTSASGRTRLTLELQNHHTRAESGKLTLTAPPGWGVNPTTLVIDSASARVPWTADVVVTAPRSAGAAALQAHLSLAERELDVEIPIVRVGNRRRVVVRRSNSGYTIDNGRIRLVVDPDFGPSVRSLVEAGVEMLLSAHPVPRAFSYFSPWYGGISPLVYPSDNFPGNLHKEAWTGREVGLVDSAGTAWRGVTLSTKVQEEEMAGLAVDFSVMTTGNSPVTRVSTRVRNLTTGARSLMVGAVGYVSLGGNPRDNVLRGENLELRPTTPGINEVPAGDWGCVVSPTGRVMGVVSPTVGVHLVGMDSDGAHLFCWGEMPLRPAGAIDVTTHFVVAASVEEVRLHRILPVK